MADVAIVKTNSISKSDKARLTRAGIIVLEVDNPNDILIVRDNNSKMISSISDNSDDELMNIVKIVSKLRGVEIAAILGKRRFREVVLARQLSIFFVSENYPHLGPVKVGDFFKIDHSTVIHAVKTIKNDLEYDFELKKVVLKIREQVSQIIKHAA